LDIGFHDRNTAATAVNDGADALAVFGIDRVAGILERFGRGRDRKVRKAVHPLGQLGIHEILRIEIAAFAADPYLEIGDIEVLDLRNARFAREHSVPEGLGSDAEWGNSSSA